MSHFVDKIGARVGSYSAVEAGAIGRRVNDLNWL
jgi:hypothetical protein